MAGASAIVSAKKRGLFLATLAACGNVTQASQVAGISWRHAHRLRAERADFAEAWNEALEQAADKLEQEAWRRAHDGVDEPVYQGGELVGLVRKYSDTLLIFLLKGARPGKYREKVAVEHSGHMDVTVAIQRLQTALAIVLPDDPDLAERFAEKVLELDAEGAP